MSTAPKAPAAARAMHTQTTPCGRRGTELALWLAIALVAFAGCKSDAPDPERDLSEAQREAVDTLRGQRARGEITADEFATLRAAIRPRSEFDASLAALGTERTSRSDTIAAAGYDGGEDCHEPPNYMLVSEIVPRTPTDPATRTQIRADLRTRNASADAAVQAHLLAQGAAPSVDARLLSSDVDGWGRYHARFAQTHDGVPLTEGGLIVTETSAGAQAVSDFTIDGLTLDATPAVEIGRAGDLALAAIDPTGALGYQASPVLMIEPDLENVLVDPSAPENGASYEWRLRGAQLVYQVVVAPDYSDLDTTFDAILSGTSIAADGAGDAADRTANTLLGGREETPRTRDVAWSYPTATPWLVTIDAQTGDVAAMESLLEEDLSDFAAPPVFGTGYGYYNSRVDLSTTYSVPLDAYVLADFSRSKPGEPNIVLHGNNLDTHDVADFSLLLDANNLWGNGKIDFSDPACLSCTKGQTPAVDIAFGVQRTYDFFEHVLGRFGTDDQGLPQVAIAHWDMSYTDAHHNGASGVIAFGNGEDDTEAGNYSLGTVAHEIGHAVWKQEAVGTAGNPAKAMNEGHGDVLGALVDIYQDNTDGQGDWLYRIPWTGGRWRGRTLDPSGYEECVTSNDIEMCKSGSRYWNLFTEIETFEHVAGIPFTRAIMHLAEGSSSEPTSPYYTKFFPTVPMRGIGLNKAARIWMHTVEHFLPPSPKLAQASFAAWQAAEDLYGPNSTEARATANAFAAVGMGAGAPGPAPPTIEFAKAHSFNLRTLTARTYAVVDDDTGAEIIEPAGMARKNDAFLGYLDLSELPIGNSEVTFRAVDSDGNEATTTRICRLRYRPQLLDDGGFEAASSSEWTGGVDRRDDEGGAFFGDQYLSVGTTGTRQTVDLGFVKGPELSYWVAANKGVAPGDVMRVRVLDAGLNELAVLAEHDIDDDWFPRPARSNGYLNFRHDLGPWEGQAVVIEFEATRSGRFRVDHAVVSYASVQLLPPGIQMFESDNSVFLTVTDDDFAPFDAMDLDPEIHVDGSDTGPLTYSNNPGRFTVHLAIDELGGGAHFAHTVAVTDSDAFVAAGNHEWFAPKPVNELLANGRFEDQLDDWQTAGLNVSLESAVGGEVYQGDFAVRLGGLGAVNEATITQSVVVPSNIKSLELTVRARREYSGLDDDKLIVDFLNASDEVLDSAVLYGTDGTRLDHAPPNIFNTHVLLSYAPSTAKLAGKTVKVRLRVVEDDAGATTFVIDNASLSYAEWGLQIGG